MSEHSPAPAPSLAAPAVARRPLRTRGSRWVAATARRLTRAGVSPDVISVASLGFAAVAAIAILLRPDAPAARAALLALAALSIQLRLLCNLLDGVVAIEGGRGTPAGPVFNEVPDRIADVVVLVAAGYAVTSVSWGPDLGWAAAVLAVGTAYVRALGVSLGAPADFGGPMAKPQRMAVMTAACLASAVDAAVGAGERAILLGLVLVAAGSAVTIARRSIRLVQSLNARAHHTEEPS